MKPSPGISTGFPKYDRLTLGLHPGELTIIAARPAMGKTSLAMNIAANVAASHTVAVFSLEMSRRSLLARLLCGRAGVNMLRFRSGVLDPEERRRISRALGEAGELRLRIDDSHLDLEGIRKRLLRLRDEMGLHAVVIDYLQLLGGRRSQTGTSKSANWHEASSCSRASCHARSCCCRNSAEQPNPEAIHARCFLTFAIQAR
jgi:replicative DNA helicase